MTDPRREHYEACAERVLRAVRVWRATHHASDERWHGVDPTVAVVADFALALPSFADNAAALELGRHVLNAEPEATWLMFAISMAEVYGPDWYKAESAKAKAAPHVVTRLPETKCPSCGNGLDCATTVDDSDAVPSPGDCTVCLNCAEVLIFTEVLGLRPSTIAERSAFGPELERTVAGILRMRQGMIAREKR
jgi:hypothetical protein